MHGYYLIQKKYFFTAEAERAQRSLRVALNLYGFVLVVIVISFFNMLLLRDKVYLMIVFNMFPACKKLYLK